MKMLERYKKRGGFIQLLNLIESFPKAKQDQFLMMIGQESPAWEAELRDRILLFEHAINWNPTVLGEIISRMQLLMLATAVHGLSPEKQLSVAQFVAPADRHKFNELVKEKTPTASEVITCRVRFVAETRALLSSNVIRVDKHLPHMMIPENIEETLNNSTQAMHFAEPVAHPAAIDSHHGVQTAAELTANSGSLAHPTPINSAAASATHGPLVTPVASEESSHNNHYKDENDFLKKRVNQLIQENGTLKHELNGLRNKLERIRKIA